MFVPFVGGATLSAGLYYLLHRRIAERTDLIRSDLQLTSLQIDPERTLIDNNKQVWARPPQVPFNELVKANWNSTIDGLVTAAFNFNLANTQQKVVSTASVIKNRLQGLSQGSQNQSQTPQGSKITESK